MSQLYELWKKLKHKLADRQFLLSLLPALLIALYLAGLLIHAAYNGVRIMFSANTSAEPIWNWNPFVAISSVFSPFGIFLIAFVYGMVFLFSGRARELLTGEKTDKDQRGFEILHDGLHGTSGWMTKEEQTHTLQVGKAESLSGTLIGKMDAEGSDRIAAVSDQLYMSGHVIVYGASGSGKTRGFTLPLILQKIELFGNARKESMVVVDPKGDLFQKTSARAKERGFFVRALNLLDPAYSDSFNCLADVEEDAGLVNIIADTIIATTSSKFEKSDFWAKAEKNLLMALIWYVVLLEDPETHKRLPIDRMDKQPLLPLKVGQVGLIAGSGMVNGYAGGEAPHVIKGYMQPEETITVTSAPQQDPNASQMIYQHNKKSNHLRINILTPHGIKSLS